MNGNPDRTIIVLPDSLMDDPGALDLAVLLGAQTRVDAPAFRVLTADQATESILRGHTVILDGLPGTNRLLDQIQSRLPLRSSADAQVLGGSAAAVRATAGERGGFGLVEEFLSPWDSAQITVLISGSRTTMLSAARQAFASGNLTGTVALVDPSGRTRSIDTGVKDQVLPATDTTSGRPIGAATLVVIVLAVLQVLIAAARGVSKKSTRA